MKKAITLLLVLGLVLLVSGFVYEVACFNLLPQHPPREVEKAFEEQCLHTRHITDVVYLAGKIFILSGIALLIYRAGKYFTERQKNKNS